MLSDEKTAEAWFESERWDTVDLFCPVVAVVIASNLLNPVSLCPTGAAIVAIILGIIYLTWQYLVLYFSVRTGTVMERSKVPLHKWAIAIYQVTTNLKSVSSMKLSRDLDITQKTAWFLLHRIRRAYELTPAAKYTTVI